MKKIPSVGDLMTKPDDFEALIRSTYNLNYLEYIVLISLYQLKEADVETIMSHTEDIWHKNKINSALNVLMEHGLCARTPLQTKGRGKSRFLYIPKPLENLIRDIDEKIKNWADHVSNALQDLPKFVKSVDSKEYQRKKKKKERIRKEWFNDDNPS